MTNKKTQKPVRIAGNPAKVQTGNLLNIGPKCYNTPICSMKGEGIWRELEVTFLDEGIILLFAQKTKQSLRNHTLENQQ
jgi:hypothetical protein